MTNGASPRTILVNVEEPGAARVMRSILAATPAGHSFFFLFAHEGLVDMLGPTSHPHGFDAQACIMNPERFCLVITFGSLIDGGHARAGSWLVRYFDEIGVPTLEIQRHLFQEGCYPINAQPQRSGMYQATSGGTVLWRYAAAQLVPWGGQGGIGYPRPAIEDEQLAVRDNLICVTSALEHPLISMKDCYKFTIAVLRFAIAHPELSLCWVVRAEELASERAKPMLEMITDAALPNLWLESSEGARKVIRRSTFGVAMPSTALLDYESEHKPVLVHSSTLQVAALGSRTEANFAEYFELERQVDLLKANPAAYQVEIGVSGFRPEKLAETIEAAICSSRLADNWRRVAPEYLAQLQLLDLAARPLPRTDLADAASIDHLAKRLTKIVERLGVIQRSTVGYKALKLVKRLRRDGGPTAG